jgi:hypothetical protein
LKVRNPYIAITGTKNSATSQMTHFTKFNASNGREKSIKFIPLQSRDQDEAALGAHSSLSVPQGKRLNVVLADVNEIMDKKV